MTGPRQVTETLIDEFRANDGKLASFGDMPLLVLHSTGAKTGDERLSILIYQDLGGSWAIFASNGGSPNNPAWYHNIIANPRVEIEVGSSTHKAIARVANEAERRRIWGAQRETMPEIDDFAARSSRVIPVVVLDPVP
ncbi:nitroreductase family deazaflavin-dependent oxidoreductase [Mycobacterium sp. SMC-4]|uniref:nitroreductase family deazaflavin-dependent oxidoreductase n=1 Tax=Mycobacterium sp. SMC-4 TaxID=2857059 RepID=UPI0021B16A47|nr:nitroreductase family deazaflavin-dependent oxidoreductase [Mycobacterium sp. SMC-4]UXA18123.1 nitroreductase family deazaflavin-dependent oxidoreductase [Mycobacterium sp. SMC-4]